MIASGFFFFFVVVLFASAFVSYILCRDILSVPALRLYCVLPMPCIVLFIFSRFPCNEGVHCSTPVTIGIPWLENDSKIFYLEDGRSIKQRFKFAKAGISYPF